MQLLNILHRSIQFRFRWSRFFVLLFTLLLVECGGGDEAPPAGGPYNPLWVYIDTQYLQSIVAASSVDLMGSAYCGDACPPGETAFGYCPAIDRTLQAPPLNFSWTNSATGNTGDVIYHGVYGSCSCLFSYCFTSYSHRWATYDIPLAIGDNLVEIKVSDISGNSATDSVMIKRVPAGLDQPTGIAVDTVNDEIFVANRGNSSIVVYARTDSGYAAPKRTVSGAATGLSMPTSIAVDTVGNEIFVLNSNSISVYDRTANGNAAPNRIINLVSASPSYTVPTAMAMDRTSKELFVTNFKTDGTFSFIAVYSLTASGSAASLRTISGATTGLGYPWGISVDPVNNEMFVSDYYNQNILVYSRTASGDVAPARTISGATGQLYFSNSVAVDTVNYEIFVNGSGSIFVFPRAANGDATPARTISDGNLYSAYGMALDTVDNEIFVTSYYNKLMVYPLAANGNVAPIRTITGAYPAP